MKFVSLSRPDGRGRHLLRALRSRNYRLFVAGQGVSLIGTWMQQVAMSWLVYRLTGSVLLLGVVSFVSHIPIFVLAPLAGVLADRCDRRRLLMATQSLAMCQAALLTYLVLTGQVQVWHIMVLSFIQGLANALDGPARQSFVVQMVDQREDLGNAIALNSSMVSAARLIGPSIAGLLVSTVGEGVCFALNSASFLAMILALAFIRVRQWENLRQRQHLLSELREGLVYAFGFGPIRSILLLVALINLLGMPYTTLLPVFASDVLHGGAHTFGFLTAAAGGGALAGTLFLASRRSVLGLGRLIVRSAILFSCGITIFALSSSLLLSVPALLMAGFGAMSLISSCNTIIQTIVEEDKRGRVMSFFTMAFVGMSPFGSLLAGSLASHVGVRQTVILGGGACLTGALVFARQLPRIREKVRPIYVRMGIVRETVGTLPAAVTE